MKTSLSRIRFLFSICFLLPLFAFAGIGRQVVDSEQQYEVDCFDAIIKYGSVRSSSHQSFSGYYDLKKKEAFVVEIGENGLVNVFTGDRRARISNGNCESRSKEVTASHFLASVVDSGVKSVLSPVSGAEKNVFQPEDRKPQMLVRKKSFKAMYDACKSTNDPRLQESLAKANIELGLSSGSVPVQNEGTGVR